MRDEQDAVWKALSDATRRRLLDLLRDQPRTTGELCAHFPGVSRFAVMKHLRVLRGAGLAIERREGRQVWHHLNAVPIRLIYVRWVSRFADSWATSLVALKRMMETEPNPAKTARPTTTSTQRRAIRSSHHGDGD